MTMTITPFFMFAGEAEEAMRFYVSVFDDAEIEILTLYPPDDPNNPGKVHHARFRLGQQGFQCIDSPVEQDFSFNAAISMHVTLDDHDSVRRVFEALSEGGMVMMPLDTYPFSPLFGWVADRFGISWQISAQPEAG